MGYIYKITNSVNDKSYIGFSCNEPIQGRIKDHLSGKGNQLIASAILKYGRDAFEYKILEANVFDAFLPDLEMYYIAKFNTVAPSGYNLTHGGEGFGTPSEIVRRKISVANKGKKREPFSAEHRHKLSEANKGKRLSAQTRRKMSESRRGEKHWNFGNPKGRRHSAETRRKISEAHKGKPKSTEMRHKLSETKTGKPLSAAHCARISESKSGEKNPNFGKRHPDYTSARDLYFSLPSDMSLRDKRKLLYGKFPNVHDGTIRKWIQKWMSTSAPRNC